MCEISETHVLSVYCSGTNMTKREPEDSVPVVSHFKTHEETACSAG